MDKKPYNVLFLCTDNSARSQMAECILNREGMGRFHAFSAGSAPSTALHVESIALLRRLNFDTSKLRAKSWDEFTAADAPSMDFIFTVDDTLSGAAFPAWPGQPMVAHWGVPDPAAIAVEGAERGLLLAEIFRMLESRISVFANLRFEALGRLALSRRLNEIGQPDDERVKTAS
jgi:arsenate reductase